MGDEKNLLTSKFAEISQKYEAQIKQFENQQQQFSNLQISEINKITSEFGERKTSLFKSYQKLIVQIKEDNKAEKEKAVNELDAVKEQENSIKRNKAELKHQTFFTAEIDKCKTEKINLDKKITDAKSVIKDSKNRSETTREKWNLETTEIERTTKLKIEKEKETRQKHSEEIELIETKIKQSQSSLYGWLNNNKPNWENTIGKVIDEETVLFNTELNPKLIDDKRSTLYGVALNLNALDSRVKTLKEYQQDIEKLKIKIAEIQKSISKINVDKESDLQKLKTKYKKKLNELKDTIAENEYTVSQSEQKLKKNSLDLNEWIDKAKLEKGTISKRLEEELEEIASKKLKAEESLERIKKGINRKISFKEKERDTEIKGLEKIKANKVNGITVSISENKKASDQRIQDLKNKQTAEFEDKGADTKRLKNIDDRLNEIEKALEYINNNEALVIEYNKDKRELFDKVPEFRANKASLEKKQVSIIDEHKIEINKLDKKCSIQKESVELIKSKLDEFDTDLKEFESFKKSDAYTGIEIYFSEPIRKNENLKTGTVLIKEIFENHSKNLQTYENLRQSINLFNGNFNEHNIFSFKVKLITKEDFLNFASDLKEFIEEDKISQYETRVNQRFAHIIQQIGVETTDLISKEAEIEKIINKINDDFVTKNFVQAIKEMEMRTQNSSNSIVKLLIQIKEFNDENSLILGEANLFTSGDSSKKNQRAVDLLKQLIKELEKSKNSKLTLSESFDLQFRIVENDNDSGWVEKLANVGSEGTDVLVKAMINILLLNVFKDSASKKFKDFKLHCMMDEIGRLHPNNVKGILRFANERNILLINGSPTSQNATDYKYTYKLAKEQSKTDSKKYITKINRLVKVTAKVLN